MKYKKRPVIVDTIVWTGNNFDEVNKFTKKNTISIGMRGLVVKTLEGEHIATIGDFIIRGVEGEYYPCKPDIFHKTYEKV